MSDRAVSRDPRVREFVDPTRVVWATPGGVTDADALIRGTENACKMIRAQGTDCGLLLDFGTELHGGVRIDSPTNSATKPVRFRVRFGESVSEAMDTPDNDHAIHDQEILISWMGHTEFGCTGFRFVRLDLIDSDVEITINSVNAVALYHDLPYMGSFECSDPRLNDIWRVGARTVHLCMQDHVWDGIKRDRLVWIGDIHPETRVISSVFGKSSLVEKSLDFAREKYPLPQWINGISSYSIWWIITQRDWYCSHGDMDYLARQKDYLLGLMDRLANCVGADGAETVEPHRFLDWSTADDPDAIAAGLQGLLAYGLKAGSELCLALGEESAAARAVELAESALLPRNIASKRKQPWALLTMAGAVDAEVANNSVLAVDPCSDMSTFYGYYVLEARAKAGDYIGCLQLMREYWGAMLDLGATSFWEHFDMEWARGAGRIDEIVPEEMPDVHRDFGEHCYIGLRLSLCHGWAAGPTAWLSEHVLGVTPASPGFRTAAVNPHLGDMQWARGTVPTPFGVVEVSHELLDNGKIKSTVVAPSGVEIVNEAECALF